ncbi:MAG: CopG family transcriptional regulator [Gemmatimonadales bacterium]
MERTTVFLPPELAEQAKRHAARHGQSFAAVIREALTSYLASGPRTTPSLPSIVGQFASGTADTAERVDDLLWKDPHA